ncbi:MAG: hypothetical protein ACE5OZ_04370 [Candidatus Heimdallarchaeota archaeon]
MYRDSYAPSYAPICPICNAPVKKEEGVVCVGCLATLHSHHSTSHWPCPFAEKLFEKKERDSIVSSSSLFRPNPRDIVYRTFDAGFVIDRIFLDHGSFMGNPNMTLKFRMWEAGEVHGFLSAEQVIELSELFADLKARLTRHNPSKLALEDERYHVAVSWDRSSGWRFYRRNEELHLSSEILADLRHFIPREWLRAYTQEEEKNLLRDLWNFDYTLTPITCLHKSKRGKLTLFEYEDTMEGYWECTNCGDQITNLYAPLKDDQISPLICRNDNCAGGYMILLGEDLILGYFFTCSYCETLVAVPRGCIEDELGIELTVGADIGRSFIKYDFLDESTYRIDASDYRELTPAEFDKLAAQIPSREQCRNAWRDFIHGKRKAVWRSERAESRNKKSAELQRIRALSGAEPPSEERKPYLEVAHALWLVFNRSRTGKKQIKALPKHVVKQLASPVNDFDNVYPAVIQGLLSRNLIEARGIYYRTTEFWIEETLGAFCQDIKKNEH